MAIGKEGNVKWVDVSWQLPNPNGSPQLFPLLHFGRAKAH